MSRLAAIVQSVSQNEIVTVEHDVTLMDQLSAESDDSVVNRQVTEYWGTDADGNEWRVHVRHESRGES